MQEWPNTQYISRETLASNGYRWLYQRWSAPVIKRRALGAPLPPPACAVEQTELFLGIKLKRVPVFSSTLSRIGDKHRRFLKRGEINISLEEPIIIGEAEWNFSSRFNNNREEVREAYDRYGNRSNGIPVDCPSFDPKGLAITLHVHRWTDSAISCIHNSSQLVHSGSCRPKVHPPRRGASGVASSGCL